MNTIAHHSIQVVCMRWTVPLAVILCTGLAQRTAHAQTPMYEEVNRQAAANELEHTADDGGELTVEEAAPLELLVLLSPRIDVDSLRDGEDVAIVYASRPWLEPDVYLLRLYAFDGGFATTLMNRTGDEVEFESDVLITSDDDWREAGPESIPIVLGNGRLRLDIKPSVGGSHNVYAESEQQTLPGPYYFMEDAQ